MQLHRPVVAFLYPRPEQVSIAVPSLGSAPTSRNWLKKTTTNNTSAANRLSQYRNIVENPPAHNLTHKPRFRFLRKTWRKSIAKPVTPCLKLRQGFRERLGVGEIFYYMKVAPRFKVTFRFPFRGRPGHEVGFADIKPVAWKFLLRYLEN